MVSPTPFPTIVGGLLAPLNADFAWRAAFIVGSLAAPLPYRTAGRALSHFAPPASLAVGVLVGFGIGLGSGCISGHGICGLARLSPRSLAVTGVFLIAAMATVFVARHIAGA